MLTVILLSVIILGIGIIGISIKLILDKKAVFKGSSCSATSQELRDKGVGECCGGTCKTEA